MEFAATAFLLGLLGAFHCVGMCGPIALALPLGGYNRFEKVIGALLYNIGRATTYGIFGWLVGFAGAGLFWIGFQQYFSVVLGVLLLLYVLMPQRYKVKVEQVNFLQPLIRYVKDALSALFRQKNFSTLYFIGVLNGLLPCGLVYAALAGALATGNPVKGSLFMMVFGLGTFPLMLAVNLSAQKISIQWRNRMRKAVPVFISFIAVLLILRGLNLGIPYLSPKLVSLPEGSTAICH